METVHQDTRREHSETLRLNEVGLVAFLAAQPGAVVAYLFGSLAEERATPCSDVDIPIFSLLPPIRWGDRQL